MKSTDSSASAELLDNLESVLTSTDIEHVYVSSAVIQEDVKKLKHGNGGGDSLVSDHILFASARLHQILSGLFTTLLRHGFMPTARCDATIQSILFSKDSKDPTLSANYHGIALASSLGKILEWSILTAWSDYFTTSDVQFGFRCGFSTIMCTVPFSSFYILFHSHHHKRTVTGACVLRCI